MEPTPTPVSLDHLADLVRQQAAELQDLRAEVRRLRAHAAEDSPSFGPLDAAGRAGEPTPGAREPSTRRGVLRAAGLVGLGSAVGAVASAGPAAATTGTMPVWTARNCSAPMRRRRWT